ncbi:DUF885 domain-containing protein [Parvularcula maris]|uniref:DUF885 domain-containing protein n=1 Tax=Parvularcula maris TaxID=2965077 RepID=A0A9X2RH71_9PROT|nr:DUF885 domain-containing protein [Parvularcula maris]MCQ8184544.1 DUF885 domain-containing protein [Parvularcula maris]
MSASSSLRFLLAAVSSAALLAACSSEEREPVAPGGETLETPAAQSQADSDIRSADESFDLIIEESSREYFRLRPSAASQAAITDEEAGGRYKDRFETPGLAGVEERRAASERMEERLGRIDISELSPANQEAYKVMLAKSEAVTEAYAVADAAGYVLDPFNYYSPYNITQIFGVHVNLPQFMTNVHKLETADDVEAYLSRLDLFYEVFEGEIEIFQANAAAGVLPPDYAITGAIANAARFIEGDPVENVLVTHLRGALEGMNVEGAEEFVERAVGAVETSVLPAYEALIETLRSFEEQAVHDAGIWDLPRGGELYAALVKVNGETEFSPSEVHDIGLSEVARIHEDMGALFEQIGLTEGRVGQRLSALTADPDQVFPNTDEGREELLAYVRDLAAKAEEVMGDYFLVTPSSPVEVVRVPEYAEQGAPGGYYNSPAEDGSRPGRYFINLRDTATQPKFSLPTLTYHEAVPGHHFQLALATDEKDTPLRVRQEASTNGFVEGWALYSESFAEEIGLYEDDPYGDLGRLRDELFRAVRLVVDTGMHHKQWSREEAIDYMVKNAGMEPSGVAIEIERYSVWPGQALGYKLGMLKIQQLRREAEAALGEDFDVAAFHYQVLRGGGAPIPVLEERIDAWVAEGGPRPVLN